MFYVALITLLFVSTVYFLIILESEITFFKQAPVTEIAETKVAAPFPVSVNPANEVILEQDQLELYSSEQLVDTASEKFPSWLQKIITRVQAAGWYQNLASPVARTIVIWPGQRSEEVAENIGEILHWNADERAAFIRAIATQQPVLSEGKMYPGKYIIHREASPEEVANMISVAFQNNILNRYTKEVASQVPFKDALIIASLLEREASDFENMREVAGVIWNRLFINMPLQLDATLQYVRANEYQTDSWWPIPAPRDKFISSPFNTYQSEGLPPAPIANVSSDAVLAALNPIPTDCIFYFHAVDGSYFCSETYEEHVQKLTTTFGRGR